MPENTSLAPEWVDDKTINEVLFCREFLQAHPMISVGGAFFTKDGLVPDEGLLKKQIYDSIKDHVTTGLGKKVGNLLEVLRMECCVEFRAGDAAARTGHKVQQSLTVVGINRTAAIKVAVLQLGKVCHFNALSVDSPADLGGQRCGGCVRIQNGAAVPLCFGKQGLGKEVGTKVEGGSLVLPVVQGEAKGVGAGMIRIVPKFRLDFSVGIGIGCIGIHEEIAACVDRFTDVGKACALPQNGVVAAAGTVDQRLRRGHQQALGSRSPAMQLRDFRRQYSDFLLRGHFHSHAAHKRKKDRAGCKANYDRIYRRKRRIYNSCPKKLLYNRYRWSSSTYASLVPPRRGEPEQVRRPLWKYVWNTSPKNTAASTPCGISPPRRRSAVLWKFRKPNVHIWQYDEAGRVWTGSKIDKFVKSSEIVNIFRLAVDILQNFWYCDGVRKVVPIFGKQVIPDGLMCSAM